MAKRFIVFLGMVLGTAAMIFGTASLQGESIELNPILPVNSQTNQTCSLSPRFPPEIQQWCELISQHATANDLDPNLVAALIWQESGGNPQAYSKDGAVGLMQVMPRDGIAAKFQCVNGPCFASRPSMAELYDPVFNIEYGTHFLGGLVSRQGSLRDALKAYGPANVDYYYADIVLNLFQEYR